jgi:hypothetical protein
MTDTMLDQPLPSTTALPTLWAVHVQGADDIHAMRTNGHAELFKSLLDDHDKANADREHVPVCNAVVIEWPGTRDEHAQILRDQNEE